MNETYEFKYNLYQEVATPLCEKTLITMLGVDDNGKCYYCESNVQGVNNKWWKEDLLISK